MCIRDKFTAFRKLYKSLILRSENCSLSMDWICFCHCVWRHRPRYLHSEWWGDCYSSTNQLQSHLCYCFDGCWKHCSHWLTGRQQLLPTKNSWWLPRWLPRKNHYYLEYYCLSSVVELDTGWPATWSNQLDCPKCSSSTHLTRSMLPV